MSKTARGRTSKAQRVAFTAGYMEGVREAMEFIASNPEIIQDRLYEDNDFTLDLSLAYAHLHLHHPRRIAAIIWMLEKDWAIVKETMRDNWNSLGELIPIAQKRKVDIKTNPTGD